MAIDLKKKKDTSSGLSFGQKRERLEDMDPEILLADGFEDALIGYAEILSNVVAVYDRPKCIEILRSQGMSEGEAHEYFEENVIGAYLGERTPAFVTLFDRPR